MLPVFDKDQPLETSVIWPAPGPGWRELKEAGRFDEAYRQLEGGSAVEGSNDPGELLAMSDVARLAGHPRGAVAPLSKLVAEHASDARAPLAAFTLGRVNCSGSMSSRRP